MHRDPDPACFGRLSRLGLRLAGTADRTLDEEPAEADPRRAVGRGHHERLSRGRPVAGVVSLDLAHENLGLGGLDGDGHVAQHMVV